MNLTTCVAPSGRFVYGVHKRQEMNVANLRESDHITALGNIDETSVCFNEANFPNGDINTLSSGAVFEIRNAFPFWGTTYIGKNWADARAQDLNAICMPRPAPYSFSDSLGKWLKAEGLSSAKLESIFETLPEPLLLALATTSTDPDDLIRLARLACEIIFDPSSGLPAGLKFKRNQQGRILPVIYNEPLFEAVANNRFLPDNYKEVMVLRPGVQGSSAIVGDWLEKDAESHIYEYIRGNSYIPFGHYAANMAQDAVRYQIKDLTRHDMIGLRHLYYQRTYLRLAEQLEINLPTRRKRLSVSALENLRRKIQGILRSPSDKGQLKFNGSLWGWNFGFDYAPTHYRLHASHQQIHQQFALIPAEVSDGDPFLPNNARSKNLPAFSFGDMIANFIRAYHQKTDKAFFKSYLKALRNNHRMDGADDKSGSLTVYADDNVIIFTPKAQTSQWELQMMTLAPVGNILEADTDVRYSIDRAMLIAVKILEKMGARMITCMEASKRFDDKSSDQRLLYFFLPKIPQSPISFTQAQLRWINGHYPEDFAAACRAKLAEVWP